MSYKIKLYHYVHCPFCIRVRMALGFLKQDYISVVISYDDEKTPIDLCGKKMLPIAELENKTLNESMDIIASISQGKIPTKSDAEILAMEELTTSLGKEIHSLAMPYFIWTQEFNADSRSYFQKKKEIKRGPFKELMQKKSLFIEELTPKLNLLEQDLKPFYKSSEFTLLDIMLASHLWALFIVPEFQFSPKLFSYLMEVKTITSFDYHSDYMK